MRTGLALAALLLAGTARAEPAVTLENSTLRLELDAQHGSIVSLVDRATGRDFVQRATAGPLYELQLVDSDTVLANHNAASLHVRREGEAIVVEGEHRNPPGLRVACRLQFEEDSPFLLGRISVHCPEPCCLAAVRFPLVSVHLPLSDSGADDALLLPYCDGLVVQDPLKNAITSEIKYPGAGSMQFLAAFDKRSGVYLASRDAAGYAKSLLSRRRDKDLVLGLQHLPPQSPARQWDLAYDTALTTFHAPPGEETTWEIAAELYRAWAVRQPWCRSTLAQRVAAGDVPQWLTEPSLFYAFSLRGQEQAGQWAMRLPLVAQQAAQWRTVLGGPVTFMLMSWEKRGSWVTPDYFPPVGGESAFTAVTRQLHEQGDRTLVFLSGLRWTLHKELPAAAGRDPTVIDDQAEFERRGRPSAVSNRQGEALITGKPERDVGQLAEICATTPLAREILCGSSQGCQRLGIDVVQADQLVGGGMPTCYHPRHDHPPGGGNWCSQALYRHFAQIRREGKARDAHFAFSIEEPGEFFIPVLDTYHARDYQQGRWPRLGNGVRGVPLFTHVYHDYLHGYGGDSCFVSQWPSGLALYQQGMNLVCGKAPGVAVWTRWFEPLKIDPAQGRLLRGHFDLWRGPARDFLVFGRRVATPPLDVPPLEIAFSEKEGAKKRLLAWPSVLHSAWQLPDGRIGWVFVCIAERPVAVAALGEKFTLQPGQAVFRPQR